MLITSDIIIVKLHINDQKWYTQNDINFVIILNAFSLLQSTNQNVLFPNPTPSPSWLGKVKVLGVLVFIFLCTCLQQKNFWNIVKRECITTTFLLLLFLLYQHEERKRASLSRVLLCRWLKILAEHNQKKKFPTGMHGNVIYNWFHSFCWVVFLLC